MLTCTFNNVVGNTFHPRISGGTERHIQRHCCLQSSASDVNVDLAEGADSLPSPRVQPTPLLQQQAGNDTVVAALTLAGSSVEAAAGDDSLSISVLSGSTVYWWFWCRQHQSC